MPTYIYKKDSKTGTITDIQFIKQNEIVPTGWLSGQADKLPDIDTLLTNTVSLKQYKEKAVKKIKDFADETSLRIMDYPSPSLLEIYKIKSEQARDYLTQVSNSNGNPVDTTPFPVLVGSATGRNKTVLIEAQEVIAKAINWMTKGGQIEQVRLARTASILNATSKSDIDIIVQDTITELTNIK